MREEDIAAHEDSLEDVRPQGDELINRRITHRNFAITIRWANIKTLREKFVYASELSEFLRISQARANQILNDLTTADRFEKKFPSSNLVEYWFKLENGVPIIRRDFERANKTLKIKHTINIFTEVKR